MSEPIDISKYGLDEIKLDWVKDKHIWRVGEICDSIVGGVGTNVPLDSIKLLLHYLERVKVVLEERRDGGVPEEILSSEEEELLDRIEVVMEHPICAPIIAERRLSVLLADGDPDVNGVI